MGSNRRKSRLKPRGGPVPKNPHLFEKGKSGNPKGVPEWYKQMRGLLRSKSPDAIKRIIELSEDKKNKRVSLSASQDILDRSGLQGFKTEPDKLEATGDIRTIIVKGPNG